MACLHRGACSLKDQKAKKRRILFLITSLEQGGAEQVLYDTVTGLDKEKWDVVVLAMRKRGPYFQRLRFEGYVVESLDIKRKFAPGAFLRLMARIAFFRPDIIHSHLFHADLPGRIASFLARGHRRSLFISHQHIPEQRFLPIRGFLDRSSRFLVDAFICVSEAVADHVRVHLKPKPEKLVVLPNGRNLRPFLAIPPNKKGKIWRFGTVGRLDKQKDQLLLLEALFELKKRRCSFHCVIAGEGPLNQTLREHIERLDLVEEVDLLGRREDIPEILAALDLFIMSSRYEGLPIAVIEAMAAGLPIVATDVPGLRDVLTDTVGQLVPYRNVEALADGIEAVMGDDQLRLEMGRQGRQRARLKYSRERMLTDLTELYDKLLLVK
jgi:glycosyltransferase involved in cell wall biosynthesis